ncbi:MAG: ABC transporter ATP-binding protein [Actinobacteria bacterium]|nr:ABC transporter ATP-binding protein [Actinomycetota bacterium]
MSTLTLEDVAKRYPNGVDAVAGIDIEVADGECLVLVGPSGCGKSTLLRMIAGLETLTAGTIRVGAEDVTTAPPKDRDVAMVFQSYALYPHMTVAENLGFGLKMAKVPKAEAATRVADVARTLGLAELLERKPAALSGGQRQRVAMGRAIVREPKLFLMDEPLSNLDAKLRGAMRSELVRLHERLGVTTVYVTHDQTEAMTLGDRVAVLLDGKLQQLDTPTRLFERPANVFVAGFIGSPPMNLVRAEIAAGEISFGSHRLPVPAGRTPAEGPVILGIRPTDIALDPAGMAAPAPLGVTIDLVERLGAELQLEFPVDAPRYSPEAVAEDDGEAQLLSDDSRARFVALVRAGAAIAIGESTQVQVDLSRIHLFDPATGEARRA